MPIPAEKRIYRLAGVCAILAIASFVAPRFVHNPEGAFASGASAISTLIIMLAVTLVFSLYLLTVTLQNYGGLSSSARFIGLAPSLIFGVALLSLIFFLGY